MRMAVATRQPPLPFLRYGVPHEVTQLVVAIGELQHTSSAACQPLHCHGSPALGAFSPAVFAHEAAPGHGGPWPKCPFAWPRLASQDWSWPIVRA